MYHQRQRAAPATTVMTDSACAMLVATAVGNFNLKVYSYRSRSVCRMLLATAFVRSILKHVSVSLYPTSVRCVFLHLTLESSV